jgi:hypothetical protein
MFAFFYLQFLTFIRIHWYTVPPTFRYTGTVREDEFDYIVFVQMNILDRIQQFMHLILISHSHSIMFAFLLGKQFRAFFCRQN